MDLLEKKNYYNNLYDHYQALLTDKQRIYFQNYYFDDLTLAEIADAHSISRNAVFDQLKKVYATLEQYEDKLGLFRISNARYALFESLEKKQISVDAFIEELKNLE